MFQTDKGHAALRKGRISLQEATYFITICVDGKSSGLEVEPATQAILAQSGDPAHGWNWRAVVVMPDHIHLASI